MRTSNAIILFSAAIVSAALVLVGSGKAPLGVPGEWEWLRVPIGPTPIDLTIAWLGCLAFAAFAGLGARSLKGNVSAWREAAWLAALAVGSVGIQGVAQSGAPVGYGLEKWVIALSQKGSNGYFSVAKDEVSDLPRFLAEYPDWITKQDALHIGTHPPGLIATQYWAIRAMKDLPGLTAAINGYAPDSVAQAFRFFDLNNRLGPADRATLVLTGLGTWLACGLTVVPLYLLARSELPPLESWGAAVLWPLMPSAVLFQPTADAAFPILSTTAMALSAHGAGVRGSRGLAMSVLAGAVLGVGMQFTLAFLAVGFVVALIVVSRPGRSVREKLTALLAIGIGFLTVTAAVWVATGASPLAIWWANQKNHARFYEEYPRRYVAWLVANPIELAVGLGLPAAAWAFYSSLGPRTCPRASLAAAATLALLTFSGRNLSEVGRLWLPFMPALLLAAGAGMGKARAGPWAVAATVALTAILTLGLQSMIQVVYPV